MREKYCCGWQIPAESASRTRHSPGSRLKGGLRTIYKKQKKRQQQQQKKIISKLWKPAIYNLAFNNFEIFSRGGGGARSVRSHAAHPLHISKFQPVHADPRAKPKRWQASLSFRFPNLLAGATSCARPACVAFRIFIMPDYFLRNIY